MITSAPNLESLQIMHYSISIHTCYLLLWWPRTTSTRSWGLLATCLLAVVGVAELAVVLSPLSLQVLRGTTWLTLLLLGG